MATPGSFKGNLFRLSINDDNTTPVEIARQEGFTININGDEIPATYKGANDWVDTLTGTKRYNFTIGAHIVNDGSNKKLIDFFNAIDNDTLVAWECGSGVSGDLLLSGVVRVIDISASLGVNEVARYDVTCNGQGSPTFGTAI